MHGVVTYVLEMWPTGDPMVWLRVATRGKGRWRFSYLRDRLLQLVEGDIQLLRLSLRPQVVKRGVGELTGRGEPRFGSTALAVGIRSRLDHLGRGRRR